MELRLATGGDGAGIAEIYGPIVASTPISFETDPPDAHEIERRVLETMKTYPWLVCEAEGRVAGYAYASRHRARAAYNWSVEVSAYVHHEFRGRHIGRALYISLFEILKAQGYCQAYAGITLPNPGSVGLHESMGFAPVGVFRQIGYKLGAWHDVGWWQRALREGDAKPETPLTLGAVRNSAAWPRMLAAGIACLRPRG